MKSFQKNYREGVFTLSETKYGVSICTVIKRVSGNRMHVSNSIVHQVALPNNKEEEFGEIDAKFRRNYVSPQNKAQLTTQLTSTTQGVLYFTVEVWNISLTDDVELTKLIIKELLQAISLAVNH